VFLHLIGADRKFVGPIREMFEAVAPGRHCYVLVGPMEEGFALPDGVTHAPGRRELADAIGSRSDWDGIVVNGLAFSTLSSVVDRIPHDVSIAWYVWGFEAYGYWDGLSTQLFLPETLRVQRRLTGPEWKRWLRSVVRRARRPNRDVPRLLSRYDYCVTPLREEYELFIASGLPTTTRFHWGTVGLIESGVGTTDMLHAGDDFQLGNSASLTNNHLDAFLLLRTLRLESRRVVVPLGYGDPRYRDVVLSAGREMLGSRFCPLVDFIPLDEYLEIVRSCGHVVMNHCRQQALGNISASLWRGARVYMNETSAYIGLRRLGFDVRRIREDLAIGEGRSLKLGSDQQTSRHRDLLLEHFGRDKVLRETMDLLERLAGKRGRD